MTLQPTVERDLYVMFGSLWGFALGMIMQKYYGEQLTATDYAAIFSLCIVIAFGIVLFIRKGRKEIAG